MEAVQLLLSDNRGIYIPKNFYNDFDLEKWNVSNIDLSDLDNVYSDGYWDTWNIVLNNSFFISENGDKFNLYQDGDLWAVCYDKLTKGDKESLGFED